MPTPPIDWSKTVAYTSVTSTGEGVSIALAGREPEGTVAPADYERVRDEVAAKLLAFTDPATGQRPIGAVRKKEEVLSGPYLDRAPDLLLEAAPLYSLTHARQMVEEADWLSGDHRPEGIYVTAGPDIDPRRRPEISLADFAGWVDAAAGLEPATADLELPAEQARPAWCSPRTRSARSRSGCAGWAICSDAGAEQRGQTPLFRRP